MKRLSAALLLALYASSTLASTLPSTVTTTTTTIPGNSSLLDDVIEATNARNNLKVVPTSQIGSTLVTQAELSTTAALSGFTMGAAGIAGLAYYQRTGKDPVYAAAASIASAADAIFAPAYQAFKATFVSPESYPASAAQYIGKESSVGGSIGNIQNVVTGNSSSYPLLAASFQNATQPATAPLVSSSDSNNPTGVIFTCNDGVNRYVPAGDGSGHWGAGYRQTTYSSLMELMPPKSQILNNASGDLLYITSSNQLVKQVLTYSNPRIYDTYIWIPYTAIPTTLPGTHLLPPPGVNYDSLKNAFNASNADAAFANEVRSAISNLPSDQKITSANPNPTSVPASSPSPITNNDISNFFTANTTNVYNQYLNTVNNGGDVNTAQAAAELAKAQEEEAEKETEEKFNALDANPFQNPYNPGPFDIPTRFTTFLQNVKTSGLFSFSSAFFNSLPGGGSPLFTVNGGQTFGTHTFDFSQSLGGGLAILKSVLLALFGFLSVRAVIMKR